MCVAALACGSEPTVVRREVPAQCADGDEREERHGTDCGCCHGSEFGVSGSVARTTTTLSEVVVEDAAGVRLQMAPNAHRNFFRHAALTFPLRAWTVSVDGGVSVMSALIGEGSCNRCHRETGGEAQPIGAP